MRETTSASGAATKLKRAPILVSASAGPSRKAAVLFGFANAGVPFEQIGPGTYYVVGALLAGKPIGILLFSAAARLAGAHLPAGLCLSDLVVVGIAASIGFTVSLFFATAAFSGRIRFS